MKIILIDPMQEDIIKTTKINYYQELGFAQALKDLGHDVYFAKFGEKLKLDFQTINLYNVSDINNFDMVILINHTLNFFGGQENKSLIPSFKLMAKFNKPIVFLYSDFDMPFQQIWEKIKDRNWESVKGLTEQDVRINKIYVAVNSYDLSITRRQSFIKDVEIIKWFSFPVHLTSLYLEKDKTIFEDINSYLGKTKNYDIIYGGSFRGGKREKKMFHYLFNTDYSVFVNGNISIEQFKKTYKPDYDKPPIFNGKVDFAELSKVNSNSLATIVFGDKSFENHLITLRIPEGLRDDLVIFIDDDFDKERKIFNNSLLKEFNYVFGKYGVDDKITILRNDKELLRKIIEAQRQEFNERFSSTYLLNNIKQMIGEIYENQNS
jgi:hypothetical protein